jgi:fatty acid desaturase
LVATSVVTRGASTFARTALGQAPRRDVVTATFIESTHGDFRVLANQVRQAGLLDRRSAYYVVKIGCTVLAFALGWVGLYLVGDSWSTLGIAAFLGLMFTQLGFVGHDLGHLQVCRTRRANWLLGLGVGNALIGLSFGWWVPKHSQHHATPNQLGLDPDLDAALVPGANVGKPTRGIAAAFARWQAWLFFPLMLLRSVGLHFYGIQRLVRNRDRAAAVEGSLIALHVALYLTIVLWVLSPLKALAFIAVQQAIFSVYLGCSFAPNHKAMPIIERDAEMSFARRQVTTSRNITGGPLTNFMLGGLNYQIEHHLFPSMPRPNLARAQRLVRAFCIEGGLGYCEDTMVATFHQVLRQLQANAVPAA